MEVIYVVQFKNGLHENMKVIDIVNNISIYLNTVKSG